MTLVATCSENRSKLRNWEISNPNLFPVEVDWQIIGSEQGGALVAESGTTPFSTLVDFADETYTLQILWYTEEGQAKRQRKQSLKTPCDLRGLTLTSVCTDDPNGRKKWQIFNPNNFSVEAAWEMEGSDLTDTLDVPTDISFFYSATQPENHIVKLIWADEEGNIKRQRKSADFGSCVELNTFSHVRIESDMNDSDIGETKFRIYPNPFDNNIIINALSDRVTKDSWSLKIYNSKGSKVHELNSENIGTLYDVEINTSNFPNGTYFVIFNMNKRREKVIIIKR
ncbi:MAG: T9SS type A sorting domain-containing protein [Bacteroidota bacterium]